MPGQVTKVDYRLLECRSEDLLCSRCLRRGIRRPVPQLLSRHHRPRSLCPACAREAGRIADRALAAVVPARP